ncbi:peptidoglycan DD-metalloendopeptidase family protein [Siminovitchia terrae]|uniref:peptidoglycan DD-metalloendopeptidase family protein n=1 Tax=Siminovitchia terrae TaxID=1914933 RepID=UPI0028ADDACA|nr:peptidoglycan DD-metalloendopeptidase family protein [Siminovitchia terrae]
MATIRELRAKFSAEVRGFQKSVQSIQKEVNSLIKGNKTLNDSFRNTGKGTDTATKKFKAADGKILALNKTVSQSQKTFKTTGSSIASMGKRFKATGVTADNLSKSVKSAGARFRDFTRSTGKSLVNFGNDLKSISNKTKEVGDSLTKKISKPAAGAASALAGIAMVKGLGRLIGIDTARAKLQGLGHDAEGVEKIMESALDSVRGTSFGMDEAATTAANAVAAGVKEGKTLTRYLSLTGDAAAIAGASMSEMGSILNKVKTSNKAYNGELQQLSDRGLPVYQWLAKEANVAADAVFDMASDGQISSEMLMNAIEKNIGGAAKKMGETSFTAGLANMWAAVGRIGASFLDAGGKGGGFFSQLKPLIADFTGSLDTMGGMAEKAGVKFGEMFASFVDKAKTVKSAYDKLSPSVQSIIDKVAIVGSIITVALGPVLVGLSMFGKFIANVSDGLGKLLKFLSPAIDKIKKIGSAVFRSGKAVGLLGRLLGFLTGPIGIAISVITGLASAFVVAYKKSETFRNVVQNVVDKVKPIIEVLKDAFVSFKDSAVDSFYRFIDFYNKAAKKFKDGFGKIVDKVKLGIEVLKGAFAFFKADVAGSLSGKGKAMEFLLKLLPAEQVQWVVKTTKKIREELSGLIDFYDKVAGKVKKGMDLIKGALSYFKADSGTQKGKSIEFMQTFLPNDEMHRVIKAVQKVKGVIDKVKDYFSGLKDFYDQLTEKVNKAKDLLRGALSYFQADSGTQKGKSIEFMQTFLSNEEMHRVIKVVQKVKEVISDVTEFFKARAEEISAILAKEGPKFLAFFGGVFKAVWTGIKTVAAFFRDKIYEIKAFWDSDGEQILQAFKNIFEGISTVVKTVMDFLVIAFKKSLPVLKKIFEGTIKVLVPIAKSVWSGIRGIFKVVKTTIEFLVVAFEKSLPVLRKIFEVTFKVLLFIAEEIWDNISGVIDGAIKVIMGIIEVFSGLFTGDFKKMWEGIKKIFFGALKLIWNGIQLMMWGKLLKGIVSLGKLLLNVFRNSWKSIKNTIAKLVKGIVDFVKDRFTKSKDTVNGIFLKLRELTKKAWDGIRKRIVDPVKSAVDAVKARFTAARDTVYKIFNKIRDIAKSAWEGIRKRIVDKVKSAVDAIKTRFTTARDTVRIIFNKIKDIAKSAWDGIKKRIIDPVKSAVDTLKTRFTNARDNIRNIFNKIKDIAKSSWDSVKKRMIDPVKSAVSNIKDRFTTMRQTISDIFKKMKDNVGKYVSDMVKNVKDMPGKMKKGLVDMGYKLYDGAKELANKMVKGLGKGVNGVIDGVNWVLKRLEVKTRVENWPVPKYARGTDGHPQDGPAIVGDGKGSNAGEELIRMPNGQTYLSPARPTMVHLPKGAHVWSALETKEMLNSVPQYGWGTVKKVAKEAKGGLKKVGNVIKDKATAIGGKIKSGASKVKDTALDIFDYISNPGKALNKAMEFLGVSATDEKGSIGDIARGGFKMVKDKAIGFIREKFESYAMDTNGYDFGAPFHRTSGYGMRWGKMHKGVDWAAPSGTPIPALAGGKVVSAGFGKRGSGFGGYGNYVLVQGAGGLSYLYAHNSKNKVKAGDAVSKGQILGLVGSTGDSTGPHVHFEVRKGGQAINPEAIGGGVAGTASVRNWIKAAMGITGVPDSWLKPLTTIAMKESGGNPRVVNTWDINAKRGTPSMGLMQTIMPTFMAYKKKGLDSIMNPIHNAVAAINYIKKRYGTVFNTPGIKSMMSGGPYRGYADGGIVDYPQLAWIAEGGWAESIISHDPAKRVSQRAIWEQTGRELGFDRGSDNGEVISLLMRIAEAVEAGQDLQVIMNDQVVARVLEPVITKLQGRKTKRTRRAPK